MGDGVTVVKCPNCGADMLYDPVAGALSCSYCGGTKAVEKRVAGDRDFLNERAEGEVDEGIDEYECPNCGGHSQMESFTSTHECPFCGATNIIKKERLRGLKPDSILPFTLAKDAALAEGKKWIKKRLYAPSKLKKNFVADKFKGVYVPSFVFKTNTNSVYSGTLGENYTVAVRTSKGVRYETRTRWFRVSGTYGKYYSDVVVEASAQLEQSQMNKILPFDLATAEQYKREYLAGFSAERYSSSLDDSFGVARGIIENDLRACILSQYKYDVVGEFNVNTSYSGTRFNYTMLPVWVCGYKYRKRTYSFIVNGRTGKSTGKTPVSVPKVLLTILIAGGIIATLVCYFMGLF